MGSGAPGPIYLDFSRVILTGVFLPGKIGDMEQEETYTVFAGSELVAGGTMEQVLRFLRVYVTKYGEQGIRGFSDRTGKDVDFDLRGVMPVDVRMGPGRPKLGVVSREVSLLPRHWEWLQDQPQGASAAIRRLIDQARQSPEEKAKLGRAAAGRFLTSIAGDMPGFEEVTRALYAGDQEKMMELMNGWPADVKKHAKRLMECEI